MRSLVIKTIFRREARTSWCRAARFLAALVLIFASLGAAAMERVDAITLDTSAGRSKSVLTSGDSHWAWVVAEAGEPPNELVKIDLTTFDEVSSVDFAEEGDWAAGPVAAIDPFGAFIYVAYTGNNGLQVIAKVNATTMQRVTGGDIDYPPTSLVIDGLGDYAYMGTDEGFVEKIDLSSMQVVGQVDTGATFLRSAAIDRVGNNLYLGTDTAPGAVVKVDLASFQLVDVLVFTTGEVAFRSAVVDPAGTAAYFGTYATPAQVAKVDLATFEPAGTLTFDANVVGLLSAAIDGSGTYAYFGSTTTPPRLLQLDLAAFQLADTLMLDGSDGGTMSVAMSSDGQQIYVGTDDLPGKVVKVARENPAPNLLRFDPGYLDFNDVELGSGQTRTAILENAGTNAASALSFASSLPDGMSVDTTSCGTTLDVGANCEVQFTYAPTLAETLGIDWGVSSAEGATGRISLLGRAVPVHFGAEITPAVLDFGGINLGATSAQQTFTLTNTGSTSMFTVMFQADGDRAQDFDVDTTACNNGIDPGESCVVQVQFHPSGIAPDSVSLSLDSPTADARIALAGYGTQSADSELFDPTSLDFGSVGVGETATRSVTLHNYGYNVATDLVFTSSDAAFSADTSLCTTIVPLSFCIVDVMFTPGTSGVASAVLTLTTGEGAHLELPLSGVGSDGGSNANLVFDTPDIDFGPVGIGTTADPQTVVLRNEGNGAASVSSIQLMSPFEADGDDCIPEIDPGEACTIRIGYSPQQVGKDLDTLTVIYGEGASASLLVSGEGSTDAIFQGGFD